ncbi:MAG: acyl carrier protein [Lachnospiraceae bacterium]|nr:acyl carrier protein [Lachnospiraceae bacterium]
MELDLLKKIIADVLSVEPDDITSDTTFIDDLGADSLDVYQIIMAVEDELGIEIDENQAEKIRTVGDAVDLIRQTKGED